MKTEPLDMSRLRIFQPGTLNPEPLNLCFCLGGEKMLLDKSFANMMWFQKIGTNFPVLGFQPWALSFYSLSHLLLFFCLQPQTSNAEGLSPPTSNLQRRRPCLQQPKAIVALMIYSNIENLVLPPGCKPYGQEAGPPARRGTILRLGEPGQR
jgi:hypothetical protein